MFPYLFHTVVWGHAIRVPTYGVLIAIALSAGYFLSVFRASELGEDPRHVDRLFLIILLTAAVGGRLFHVFFENFSYFREHPAKIFPTQIGDSGLTFYGGLLSCLVAILVYTRRWNLRFANLADVMTPSVALGIAIGRLGCFCAGCCWGKPYDGFLAVTFTRPDSFCDLKNVPLHPVQLYGASAALIGFIYMMWRARHRRYEGQLMVQGLVLYAVLRFINEIFRGDDYRGYLLDKSLSYSQFISLLVLPFTFVLWLRLRRRTLPAVAVAHDAKALRRRARVR